ncbi:Major facilitator superfamily domain, general substrate transporter [Pleurostoma richardsiae]|uniref:Major facilitator superfamily domain, general substrate transporter n=1 Tax=Pleurostoma richardsiae TaxID=41990 RepID=A0AA38RJE7_9PEZI|nr:Major facilitator superfamily domain, general substrate transporter [Pleurostoma richardsiae]
MDNSAPKPVSQHVEKSPTKIDSNHAGLHHQRTTLHMIMFAFWIGFFGWLANFDAAFGGIVLLMDSYKKSFGSCTVDRGADGGSVQTCSLTALQQSLIQVTLLFMAVGGLASGLVGQYLGRRGTVQIGCVLIAAGAGGMVGSTGSFLNYMVCKCIGGLGIGMLYTAAPIWGSESVAPQKRGLLMSLYNVGLASGNVIAAAVCVGSSKLNTNWAWQTPIICQIPVAIILGSGSCMFRESPRWLLSKGRVDKARLSFAKFYQLDPRSPEVDWQVSDVLQHIETERAMNSEASFSELFRGVDFRRTHLAVIALLGNALTGIQFVIPYTALFLSQMGFTNPYTLNVAISSCVLAGTIPGPFLCEYVGRRLSLLGGYAVMGTSMLILAVVASALGQSRPDAQNVLVAFLCIWAFTFGATSGPISFVSSAEMHSLRLRTIGQAYAIAIYEVFSFGAAFWTPYMLNEDYGNMGTNVGYFYAGITAAIFVLTLFFIPETGRLSLEQIDEYFFSGGSAWNTSLRKNRRIAA